MSAVNRHVPTATYSRHKYTDTSRGSRFYLLLIIHYLRPIVNSLYQNCFNMKP